VPDYERGAARMWAREHLVGCSSVTIPTFTADLKRLNEPAVAHDIALGVEHGFTYTLLVTETNIHYAYTLLVGPHGLAAKQGVRHLLPRMQRVVGPVQEVTSADNRVRLDPTVTDSLGIPVARLSGRLHPNDLAALQLLGERAADWLRASGATTAIAYGFPPGNVAPSSGQHQAGTCRMGTDPATSVTDPNGRVWGHPNLRVIDGSLHVTNGGVNPVLTIFANAFRIMHTWVGSGGGYL